jgi:Ca-activated chloride channel family protein
LPRRGSDARPLNPIAISVRLDAGMPLASVISPYHDIALARSAGIYTIDLVGGQAEMDRDFVLRWRPVTGSTPAAALFTERVEGQYYGLLMFVPPEVGHSPEPGPRELVFVVDKSGSMAGVSIRQARASIEQALLQLRPQDSFNIIAFDDHHRALFRRSMPASRHTLELAREFVRHLDAGGGTEMLSALRAALATETASAGDEQPSPLRQVIFVTDGAVGNEAQLFAEIEANLGHTRLFTVGIGSAPNSWFMRKAADVGRGTFTYVADVNEVGETMAALFRQLAQPAALQLAVDWPAGVETWPQRLPDLYRGEPLTMAVAFGARLPAGDLVVTGEVAGRAWSQSLSLPGGADPAGIAEHRGVASIWARRKIASLLDERYRGMSGDEVRAAVLPVALAHSLLSPYTSFVAVEERISRPPGADAKSHPVPNTRPRGQSPQPYAYPVTATTAPAKLWLGALLLLGAIVVRTLRQEDHDA